MSSAFAKNLLSKVLKNDMASLVEDGILGGDVEWYVDTGSYVLNALVSGSIYGGYPANNVTALAGSSGVGKSYYAIEAAKNFQKAHPDGVVLYFESEGAIRKEMIEKRGCDTSRFIISPVITIEEFRKELVALIEAYDKKKDPKIFVILDSLGNLSTTKEVDDIINDTGKKDMTRAQLIKATFRVITLKAAQKGIPLLLTNHTYQQMVGLYPQDVMSGGSGTIYAASTIVFLYKSKDKEGTDQVGVLIRAKLPKSRITIENSEVKTQLNFKKGLNRYYGLVDIAVEAGIVSKEGPRVVWTDGKKYYEKNIYQEPDKFFTKEILDKIDEFCVKKFTYQGGGSDAELISGSGGDGEEFNDDSSEE